MVHLLRWRRRMKNLAEFLAARRFHDSEQPVLPEAGNCINCGADLAESQLYREYRICERCRYHYSVGAHRRVELLVDPGSWVEYGLLADHMDAGLGDRFLAGDHAD